MLFTAPAYNPDLPGGTDAVGPHNIYWLRNRNQQRNRNGNQPGLGGMVTQVRVYPAGTLGPQSGPNWTF